MNTIQLRRQLGALADRYSDLLDELEAVRGSTELVCDELSDMVENLYENLMLLDDPFIDSVKPAAAETCPFPARPYAAEREA